MAAPAIINKQKLLDIYFDLSSLAYLFELESNPESNVLSRVCYDISFTLKKALKEVEKNHGK